MKKINFFVSSIFSNMMMFFLLIIFISVFVIGLLSYKVSERTLLKQADNYNEKTLDYIETNLQMIFDQMVAIINMYNMNSEIEIMAKKEYEDDYDRLITIRNLEERLSNSLSSFDWLKQNITIIGGNKTKFVEGVSNSITAENFHQYPFYDEIQERPDKIHWFGPEIDIFEDHSNMITAVKLLENSTLSGYYGTIILGNLEEKLFNIYRNKVKDGKNIIFMVDANGQIISHINRDMVGQTVDMHNIINLDEHYVTYENEKYVTAYRTIEPTDWYLVQMTSLKGMDRYVLTLKKSILIAVLISATFAIISTIIISKKISSPIEKLSLKISKQHGHKLTVNQLECNRLKEVRLIDQEYQYVIGKLEITINQLMEEQKNKRRLELEALQMQINPHFLYNTLNSIRMLAWTKQYEKIDPAVTALVDLLQQTLNNRDELISLAMEMENTKNYILIQNIRKEGQIQATYSMDDCIDDCLVPKLILQPLVENAIFHGIDKIYATGKLTMVASRQDHDIKITIEDNGPGMSKEKIRELLENDSAYKERRFTGIGVKNVDTRLKLYFGEQYGLAIESIIDRGTTVVVTLPYLEG